MPFASAPKSVASFTVASTIAAAFAAAASSKARAKQGGAGVRKL